MNQIEGQAQNLAVIAVHQLLECQTVARLRTPYESLLFCKLRCRCLARISVECDAHPHGFDGRFRIDSLLTARISAANVDCAGLCPFCRFRMHRRPGWPLVSIRERGFPTIGQLTHCAASLFDATMSHRVVTKWVTKCPRNTAHQLQEFEAIRGVNNARTAPLGHEGVIRQSRDNSRRPRSQNVGKSNSEVTGGEKRIRDLLAPRQPLPTSRRIVPVRQLPEKSITNKRIGSLGPAEVGLLLAQV